MTVLNRSLLEKTASDAYGVPELEYKRLFGLPPVSSTLS
jgi:hypothetical protein